MSCLKFLLFAENLVQFSLIADIQTRSSEEALAFQAHYPFMFVVFDLAIGKRYVWICPVRYDIYVKRIKRILSIQSSLEYLIFFSIIIIYIQTMSRIIAVYKSKFNYHQPAFLIQKQKK